MLDERLAGWQEQYPDVHARRRIVCDKPARWLIEESQQAQLVVIGRQCPPTALGHRAGRTCPPELTSTIVEQRRDNPPVQPMSEDAFVELITHGQPAAPAYFSIDAAMNKRVHPLLDQARRIPALSPAQIRQALADGVRVLDVRSVEDFATGHVRGSINVGFDGRFAETGGMVAEIGDKIALIAFPGEEQDAALRLAVPMLGMDWHKYEEEGHWLAT